MARCVILREGPTLCLLLGHEDWWYECNFWRESQIPECSSVTGWFYSCGACVNIIMLLKWFPWQPWTSTNSSITVDMGLICDWSRLPPQCWTYVSGVVCENRSQSHFPFVFWLKLTVNVTKHLSFYFCFSLIFNFLFPPLPLNAHHCSHLSPPSASFTSLCFQISPVLISSLRHPSFLSFFYLNYAGKYRQGLYLDILKDMKVKSKFSQNAPQLCADIIYMLCLCVDGWFSASHAAHLSFKSYCMSSRSIILFHFIWSTAPLVKNWKTALQLPVWQHCVKLVQ